LSDLLEIWSLETANPPLSTIAAMLSTTAYCQKRFQEESSLEFVWTGPIPESSSFWRTDQALLELIRDARETLTIVSFAVYKIPEIMDALQQSVMRGVSLTFIFEVPEASDGKIAYNVASSIHSKLLGQAKLLNWAKAKRPLDSEGKTGSLHAKFAIADHQKIFVSTANLTHYAMTLNIEMGVLIHGANFAHEAAEHVDRLIAGGNFVTFF
jgi:phosphatidylserine/phosphatidylglycerophosphate/cardiolipin synthase-like enzyme